MLASPPRAPGPPPGAAEAASPAPAQGDRLQLSTGQKLVKGNRAALGVAGGIIKGLVTNPGAIFKGLGDMVAHPGRTLSHVAKRFGEDKLDGLLQGALAGSAYAGIAAMGLAGVGLLGAMFTGGASLALLPLAGTIGSLAGTVGVGAMGASLVKNQVDVATAATQGELDHQSAQLGEDFANLGLTAATLGATKGAGAAFRKVMPRKMNLTKLHHDSFNTTNKIKDALLRQDPALPEGGLHIEGMDLGTFRNVAKAQVEEALAKIPQGHRPFEVLDVDFGSFEGLANVGERRMVFHGTTGEARAAIRAEGLRPSEVGNYGKGVYMGSSADIGALYADDAAYVAASAERPGVFAAEIAPGRVFDFRKQLAEFKDWNKQHGRGLQEFCREKGYDSVFVRAIEGRGHDYWVVHDPKRVILRNEFVFDPAPNQRLIPKGVDTRTVTNAHAVD